VLVALVGQEANAIEDAWLCARTNLALAHRVEELPTMQRIDGELNGAPDLDHVISMTLDLALRVTATPTGFIALYDEQKQGLLLLASRGYPPEYDRYRAEPWPLALGVAGKVVRTGEPALLHDISECADYYAAQPATRSQLTVPIRREEQVIGVVTVESPELHGFDEDDLAFIQHLADHAALAIVNARLYQETQRRLKELSLLFDASAALATSQDADLMLQTIAQQLTTALALDGCAISLWDREQDALVTLLDCSANPALWESEEAGTAHPLDQVPISQQVLIDRQPRVVQANDAQVGPAERQWMAERGVLSLLIVPLVASDRAIGLLELIQCRQQREFTPSEARLCQIVASQAAAALENARLYEGVQDANVAKSEFIDFVAHELKQPMTAMQGYARMLTMGIGGQLTDVQQEFVQVINSNIDRMAKLVNNLLDISRLEAGRTRLKLTPVHLQEVVEEVIAAARTEIERRQHTLTVEIPHGLPPVLGDRDRLVQITTNLLSNAYKYTPNGGNIQISIGAHDCDGARPGYLLVSVRDTGIGMSPKDLLRLEEKFFRGDHDLVRAQPGSGLGVSISRSLVDLHGGEFAVESEPGRGSTFRFTVPIADVSS
jgi:signal transduction histidine kinase